MARRILDNLRIATMAPGAGREPVDGAIGIKDGRTAFAGAIPADWAGVEREDFGGRVATPALIDCHTHLVFGGNRAREFEMRLEGATYEEIARAGGGIVSTVAQTRARSWQRRRCRGSTRCSPKASQPSRSSRATASPSPTN